MAISAMPLPSREWAHCLEPDTFVFHALNLMEKHQITVLPLVNEEKKLQGMLHLHDILGKGAFQYTGGNQ